MRQALLLCVACFPGWLAVASPGAGAGPSNQQKTRELIVGKWVDPERPGNAWTFYQDGKFENEITAGVIHAFPSGTYRILPDGSLEVQVRVGNQAPVVRPRRMMVRVTRERLVFMSPEGKEESYQRAR